MKRVKKLIFSFRSFSLSFLSFNVAFCLFLSFVGVVASSSTEAIVVVVYY